MVEGFGFKGLCCGRRFGLCAGGEPAQVSAARREALLRPPVSLPLDVSLAPCVVVPSVDKTLRLRNSLSFCEPSIVVGPFLCQAVALNYVVQLVTLDCILSEKYLNSSEILRSPHIQHYSNQVFCQSDSNWNLLDV